MLRCELEANILAACHVVCSHTQRRHQVCDIFIACGTEAQIVLKVAICNLPFSKDEPNLMYIWFDLSVFVDAEVSA